MFSCAGEAIDDLQWENTKLQKRLTEVESVLECLKHDYEAATKHLHRTADNVLLFPGQRVWKQEFSRTGETWAYVPATVTGIYQLSDMVDVVLDGSCPPYTVRQVLHSKLHRGHPITEAVPPKDS